MCSALRITNGAAGATSASPSKKANLPRDITADSHRRGGLADLLLVPIGVFQLFEIVGVVDLADENLALAIGFVSRDVQMLIFPLSSA